MVYAFAQLDALNRLDEESFPANLLKRKRVRMLDAVSALSELYKSVWNDRCIAVPYEGFLAILRVESPQTWMHCPRSARHALCVRERVPLSQALGRISPLASSAGSDFATRALGLTSPL